MFDKICIKSKELNNYKMDIPFLIETMLFYGNVIVLAHRSEMITLLNFFGEDFLTELIKTGRIDLRIREDILGSMNFPNDRYNIDLMSKKGETYSNILYQAHREFVKNSSKNISFSDKFSKITEPFKYGNDVTSQIRNDFENDTFLKKTLPIYLNTIVPSYDIPEKLEIEIIKDSSFGPIETYSLNSNIDIELINQINKKNHPENFHKFNYGGFLLSLAEAKGDIFIASHFESELVTRELYSKFINIHLTEIVKKRTQSQENINLFNEYILSDCYSIGDAFVKGVVSKKELLKLLEKSDKFRSWLSNVPDDKNLIGEYHNAVTKETFADKLPTKSVRFMIFEGIGITLDILGAGGIGTSIATGLSAFDNFYLDKLIRGWKPNQFIDNDLKKLTKKK